MLAFRLATKNVMLDIFDTPYRLSLTEVNCSNSKSTEFSLTVTEGELLFLLLADKKATRELCESVLWKGRVVSDSSRSLTQVVSTLRKKLRLLGIEDFILTKPRLGYVLSNEFDVFDAVSVLNTNNLNSYNPQTTQSKSKIINEMSIEDVEIFSSRMKVIRHNIKKIIIYDQRLIMSSSVFLILILGFTYSISMIINWFCFYELEVGEYITVQDDIDSSVDNRMFLKVNPESLSVKYSISNADCNGFKVQMNYKYSQQLLARNIVLYNGNLSIDSYSDKCRAISMYSIGNYLGYGNEMKMDLVSDNNGNLCLRNNIIGLYCFKKNEHREVES